MRDTGHSRGRGGIGSNGSNSVTLGSLQTGSLVHRSQYDGLNRRIVKAVTNSGDLNCTYHYYYDKDWRVIEERNASNFVLKQMVWAPTPGSNGSGYTDELVQVRVNNNLDDPAMSQTMMDLGHPMEMYPGDHWVLQDANYNVLGLVDRNGKLVERYEYSPYGERKVFVSAGANDPGCYAPTLVSGRRTMYTMVGGGYDNPVVVPDQPFGLNEFGHQGLPHEEELDNGNRIQNRHRVLHASLGRFIQRDPLGYVDGMSLYQYVGGNPITNGDPKGNVTVSVGGSASAQTGIARGSIGLSINVGHNDNSGFFSGWSASVTVSGGWGAGVGVSVSGGVGVEVTTADHTSDLTGGATRYNIDTPVVDVYYEQFGQNEHGVGASVGKGQGGGVSVERVETRELFGSSPPPSPNQTSSQQPSTPPMPSYPLTAPTGSGMMTPYPKPINNSSKEE